MTRSIVRLHFRYPNPLPQAPQQNSRQSDLPTTRYEGGGARQRFRDRVKHSNRK